MARTQPNPNSNMGRNLSDAEKNTSTTRDSETGPDSAQGEHQDSASTDGRNPAAPNRTQRIGVRSEAEFGVARDTLRKAVKVLKDEGIVETVSGMGVYVIKRD